MTTLITCDPCVNIVNTFLISLFCSHSWLLVLNIVEINLLIINVRYIVELSFILKTLKNSVLFQFIECVKNKKFEFWSACDYKVNPYTIIMLQELQCWRLLQDLRLKRLDLPLRPQSWHQNLQQLKYCIFSRFLISCIF